MNGVVTTGTPASDDLSAVGIPAAIGPSYGSGITTDLHVAELLVVKGTVTDAEVASVEAYLKEKYKLSF